MRSVAPTLRHGDARSSRNARAEKLVTITPQWTCEILSEDKRNDLVRKKHIYHRHHVDHYWILDPEQGTLAVYRWHADGYLEVLAAERGQLVRAEPFAHHAVRLHVLRGSAIAIRS